jgi:hypothetical protein
MKGAPLTTEQIQTLSALAEGIIPRDERDAGVATLNPGRRLAQKIEVQPNRASYLEGIQFAQEAAQQKFRRSPSELETAAMGTLLALLRDRCPSFFKFLRAETCALYLSQPIAWKRIGFPGPSIQTGGHPDFDQPQG